MTKIQLKYKKIHQFDREQRNQYLKKDIEILNRKVDSLKKKDMLFNQYYFKNLVVQNFKNAEFNKIQEILKEIEYSEPLALKGMFEYR